MNKNLTKKIVVYSLLLLSSCTTQAWVISALTNATSNLTTKKGHYTLKDVTKRFKNLVEYFIENGSWEITIDDFADELSEKGWKNLANMMVEFADILEEKSNSSQELTVEEIGLIGDNLAYKHLGLTTKTLLYTMFNDLEKELQKNPKFHSLNFDEVFYSLLGNRRSNPNNITNAVDLNIA